MPRWGIRVVMNMLRRFLEHAGLRTRTANVLVVGLDNSGKTSLVKQLQPSRRGHTETTPTIGFSVDAFVTNGVEVRIFDMSGAAKYRHLWEKYANDADAVIFVIDSSDKLRLAIAKEEVSTMFRHQHLKDCPFLMCANKQDIETALSLDDIVSALDLMSFEGHRWRMISTNGLTGSGLDSGVKWSLHSANRRN